MATTTPLPIAVLISGGGTTLRNLIAKRDAGELAVDFRLVISSNPRAAGLKFASDAGIATMVLQRNDHADSASYGQAIFGACREAGVELVIMAGFVKLATISDDFENCVMNIHPSLIPAFCGKGFYGLRTHQAVLEYGAKLSGCTVHFVNNQYDSGPIILQRSVPVFDDDTAETLAARVFEQECEALPDAIRLFAERKLRVDGRVVKGA